MLKRLLSTILIFLAMTSISYGQAVSGNKLVTTGIIANGIGTELIVDPDTRDIVIIIGRTAGSTNTIGVNLQCSIEGSPFATIATVTALTNAVANLAAPNWTCSRIRYNVTTIGAGNTLTIVLVAFK